MFFHENEKCPVCDRFFTAYDDIVVCPECATPHHRECYNQLSHCANSNKHGEDFVYEKDKNISEPVQQSSQDKADSDLNSNNSYYSQKKDNTAFCKSCGKEINKSAPFCYNCGAKQDFPAYEQEMPFASAAVYDDNGDSIDGRRIKDIADTVKSNTSRFIKKFKENKIISWNWGAFFFGPYYLFFRKMYKEGIIALALNLIANIIVRGVFVEQISAYSNFISSGAMNAYFSNPTAALTEEAMSVFESVAPAMLILSGVSLIINIIITLTADKMYRAKVMSVIDKAYGNIDQNNIMGQSQLLQAEMNMNEAQMKTFYMSKMGGTSFFSPLIAYMLVNLITSFISKM